MNSRTLTLEVTVNYIWRRGQKGCGPGHYYGPTPDEPAWIEVREVELTEDGQQELENRLSQLEDV